MTSQILKEESNSRSIFDHRDLLFASLADCFQSLNTDNSTIYPVEIWRNLDASSIPNDEEFMEYDDVVKVLAQQLDQAFEDLKQVRKDRDAEHIVCVVRYHGFSKQKFDYLLSRRMSSMIWYV